MENQEKEKLRKDHNRELIRRMRNGDSLTSFDSSSSWFPPRPVIEKDETEMKRLYGGNTAYKPHQKISAKDAQSKQESAVRLLK